MDDTFDTARMVLRLMELFGVVMIILALGLGVYAVAVDNTMYYLAMAAVAFVVGILIGATAQLSKALIVTAENTGYILAEMQEAVDRLSRVPDGAPGDPIPSAGPIGVNHEVVTAALGGASRD